MFAGKSLGTKYRSDGFAPKKPVMIIPGLCSSCLKVVASPYENWVGKRIWLSMASIGFHKMWSPFSSGLSKKKNNTPVDTPAQQGEADEALKRRWLQHMVLAPDGVSDPEGIQVRAVSGLKGCKYLEPGAITDALSYVMGPLAEMLEDLGYVDGQNLDASPYDWRLPPYRLEERDSYFSNLQLAIERQYAESENTKVVIIAHSLGNRVTHYFLRFMEQKAGREWISKYIDNWLAIGPLWLGAPKLLRAIITGDRMGLEAFLFPHEGITLARSLGSTPWMFPYIVPEDHEFQTYSQLRDPSTGKHTPHSNKDMLILGGAEAVYNRYRDFFEGDPLVGSQADMLAPPPIDKMYAIYGINLKTETFYFFKENRSKKKITDFALDKKGSMGNFKCEGGIVYETKETRQNSLKGKKRGGDGTVPYPSLSYCRKWKPQINVRIAEIEGADHREILKNKTFLQLVIEYVSQAPPPTFLPVTFNDLEFNVLQEIKGKKVSKTLVLDKQYIRTCGGKETRQYYGNVSNIIIDEQSDDSFYIEFENTNLPAEYQSEQSATIVQELAARCRYIVEAKASYTEDRNEYGQTSLHVCAIHNDLSEAINVLKGHVDINAVDLNGNTPLIAAAEKGNLDIMTLLLQQSNVDVNKQANNNKSVIHHMGNMRVDSGEENKWISVMDQLKQKGVDINAVADFGETPIHQATKGGKTFIVTWLLANGCQVNATTNVGETALHYAVRVNSRDIIELLLKNGADRNIDAPSIGSPLALSKKQDPELMQFIQKFSANGAPTKPDIKRQTSGVQQKVVGGTKDEHGRTPLHIAAEEDRLDLVFSLLLQKANVNEQDKNGWTPLHCAACNNHLDVLTVLVNSYGVDVNAQTNSGSSLLHYLMRTRDFKSELIKDNYYRVLNLLKQKGVSITPVTKRGITPIHEAASRGNVDGVQWLMGQGASFKDVSSTGLTPLHFAVQSNSPELIKMLLGYRANPMQASQAGTAFEMAKKINPELCKLLEASSKPMRAPQRPPRTVRSSIVPSKQKVNVQVDQSTIDEEDDEVIYTLDEQDEEVVPGSVAPVLPLAQRRRSMIRPRASLSVVFSKPPVGEMKKPGIPVLQLNTSVIRPGVRSPKNEGRGKRGMRGIRSRPPPPVRQLSQRGNSNLPVRGMPVRGTPPIRQGVRKRGSRRGMSQSGPVLGKPRAESVDANRHKSPTPVIRALIPPAEIPKKPVGRKFCTECGVTRVPNAKFCGECGFRF